MRPGQHSDRHPKVMRAHFAVIVPVITNYAGAESGSAKRDLETTLRPLITA